MRHLGCAEPSESLLVERVRSAVSFRLSLALTVAPTAPDRQKWMLHIDLIGRRFSQIYMHAKYLHESLAYHSDYPLNISLINAHGAGVSLPARLLL